MPFSNFLLKSAIEKYVPYIFFVTWFVIFLVLSFFRDSRLDENIYLADSNTIAELLKNGQWIGNHGVGLHGFIGKLVVGIIFIFTGPSVFIATTFNILLGISSGIVFYKILFKNLKFSKAYSLLGVTLLFTSYQFLTYIPTYYRDIGALLFVLLILESILSKRNKWIVGLWLMLLLDSKEYVFYVVSCALVMWLFIESYINGKRGTLLFIKMFIFSGMQIFLPSLVFLVLMFTTSLIPLNIYNAKILGLTEQGINGLTKDFDPDVATVNRDAISEDGEMRKTMPQLYIPEIASPLVRVVISSINVILSYIGKVLYPRTFSFLSVPLVILVPSAFLAYKSTKKWIQISRAELLILPLVMFVFLLIYIFHSSISRYIIPILPIIYLFFLLFLKGLSARDKYITNILVVTLLFVLGGLYFEYSFILVKVFINIFLLLLMFCLLFKAKLKTRWLIYFTILLTCTFSFGTSILASYMHGQIGGYLRYGYNREAKEVVSLVSKSDRIWINDIYWDKLPFIYREEYMGESEWRWRLKKWIPKRELLVGSDSYKTFNFGWESSSSFKKLVNENSINKVVFVKVENTNDIETMDMQDNIDLLLNEKWLTVEKSIKMKNKTVFVFVPVENIVTKN